MKEYKGFWRIIGYSVGMAGWSVLINTISVMLVFYYLPPVNIGIPLLIPQIFLFGIFTMFSFTLAFGRLFDAVTDPLIAWLSDRSKFRFGRRIPFMAFAIIPSALFAIFLFYPPVNAESAINYYWLFIMQAGFYFFITLYIVPFNALMPELATTKYAKLIFSATLSVMFLSGVIIASQIPWLAELLRAEYSDLTYQNSYLHAIALVVALAFIFMLIPVITINEKLYCNPLPATASVMNSIKSTLTNRKFIIFIVADTSFFITLTILSSGIIYYVKVLLRLSDSFASRVLGLMILISFVFYPVVIWLVRKFGKKHIIIISFLSLSLISFYITLLGKLPFAPELQLYLISILGAFPFAVLGILPYNIVAEIAENDSKRIGEQREGMFFAIRSFANKIGQTLGILMFAVLMVYGKDIGNDSGIRYSAGAAAIITLFAAIMFFNYKE